MTHVYQHYNMPVQVTINNVSGTTPYYLYICDPDLITCFYATSFDGAPFTYDIPSPWDTMNEFCVKIIGSDGCEATDCGST